jgi:magnesium transporter
LTASGGTWRSVPRAEPADTAGEVRSRLVGVDYDTAVDVAVCDGHRLVGLVAIERLLAAAADERVSDIMDGDPPVVGPGADRERAAWKAVDHGEGSLAVVDAGGRFLGLVPPAGLLGIFLAEHDEDVARLAGFLHDVTSARTASEEPVRVRLRHRLPWLLLGLAGALLAALLVGAFEQDLEANVAVAFFVPGIVYLADAVGTQTEALVVRGLSVGVPVRRVVPLELRTGLLVGVVLAAVFVPIGIAGWDTNVGVAVALALLAACSTATVTALALPWLLARAGTDPAFGSGPLATVIQDLLSLLIYFAVATAIVG